MITKTRQNWTTGSTVKVGFSSLIVVAAIATPGDFAPDAYILKNAAGTQLYKFVPHNGVEKLSTDEARTMINGAKAYADKMAADAIAAAQSRAHEVSQINALFA